MVTDHNCSCSVELEKEGSHNRRHIPETGSRVLAIATRGSPFYHRLALFSPFPAHLRCMSAARCDNCGSNTDGWFHLQSCRET